MSDPSGWRHLNLSLHIARDSGHDDLAHRLGIKTVAEWVQDEESAAMLQNWGCDYIQGRLTGLASLSKPWDASDATPIVVQSAAG